MNMRTIRKLSLFVILGSFLTIAFNNCGKPKEAETSSEDNYSKLSDDPCEDQLMNFYSRSYQPFLVNNCASCHSTGPGKGQISHKDTAISYKDFMQIGYSKVSSNAISEGHNPPYSGSQHTQTINELKITWIKALSENDVCNGGSGEVQQVQTLKERANFGLTGKPIPVMNDNEEKRVEFSFAADLSSLQGKAVPDLKGAKLSVMVRKVLKGTERYYSVHSPRIYGSTSDIRVKGLFTKINGRFINYSTNFIFVDSKVPKGSVELATGALVSTGAVVIAGAVFPDDFLSFDFELLETTVIPPPPPPVYLAFTGNRFAMAGDTGEVSFTAVLDKPSTEVVSFTYTIDSGAICNGGTVTGAVSATGSPACMPEVYNLLCPNNVCPQGVETPKVDLARSVVGLSFNRFDWDYKLGSSSFNFDPGQTSKTVVIKTSRDVRWEKNRVLTIKLEPGIGNILVPAATGFARIVFDKKKNTQPDADEITYSNLMAGGTLFKTCTECHNSVKRDGGYDIQDYELMVSSNKRILVPGEDRVEYDANFNKTPIAVSLMYRRTLPIYTPESLLMPRKKTLTPAEYNDLENWLTNGAKNN